MSGEKIEQAAWVKPGVRVRWKGSPFGVGGVVFPIPAGPHVEVGVLYDGSSVVWEGDVASLWEPAAGAELAPSFMLDGGPCAKPEAADGLDQLDRRLSEALWLYRDNPTSAATFGALHRLWDLLTAQFGSAWSRARGDVCGDHAGRVRSEACYVCKAGPMQACGSTAASTSKTSAVSPRVELSGEWVSDWRPGHVHGDISTMDRVIARLDAIDAALKPLACMQFDHHGRVVMCPDRIQIEGVVHEERTVAARAKGQSPTAVMCPVCQSPEGRQCWITFKLGLEQDTLVKEAPARRPVPPHAERVAKAERTGASSAFAVTCSVCNAMWWEGCVAVNAPGAPEPTPAKPADVASLAATQGHAESASRTDHARMPPALSRPFIRGEPPCPRCGHPMWSPCVAVDGEMRLKYPPCQDCKLRYEAGHS